MVRTDCTLSGTLEKLAEDIKHDIRCFNDPPDEKRGSHASALVWRRGLPMVGPASANGISMHDAIVFCKVVADTARVPVHV